MPGMPHYNNAKHSMTYQITAGWHCPECGFQIIPNGHFPCIEPCNSRDDIRESKEITKTCSRCNWTGTMDQAINVHNEEWALEEINKRRDK